MIKKCISLFKNIIVLVILICPVASVYAQNATIDSLKALLSNPDADSIQILIELTKQNNIAGTYETALMFAAEAVPLALRKGDSLEIVMAYRFKGAALRRLERLDEALELITRANTIAKRNHFTSEMKYLLNSMAIIYSNKAQYDRALDCYFATLMIREAEGDQSEISIALNNIGSVYLNLENYNEALKFFNKSLIAKRRANDNYDMERLLINICLAELHLGAFDKAAENLKTAFAICGTQCADVIKIEGEFGFGRVSFSLHKLDESLKHFIASYDLAIKNNNHRYQSENLVFLGKIAMERGDLAEAENQLKDAETIANTFGYNQLLIDIYKELFRLYSLKKSDNEEVVYLKKYVSLSDSLLSLDLVKDISMIQSRFDEQENLKHIKTLEENIVLKNEAIERQQLLNGVLGIAAGLLVMIGILISRLYLLRSRSNKQLDAKVRQRTYQLEEGQTALQGVLNEQKLFMKNMREEIRAVVATLNGAAPDQQDMIYSNAVSKLKILIERIDQKSNTSIWSKAALSVIVILLFSFPVFSQQINQVRFDSIKAHLPGKTLSDRHFLMHGMAYELFDVDNAIAKQYADTAWLLAQQLGDSLKITKSGRLRGQLLRRTDRLNEAIAQFQKVLLIARRNHFTKEEKIILNATGAAYTFKADYDSALEINFHLLEVREEEGNKKDLAIALLNIGLVFYKLNDYDQALFFYKKSLALKNQINEMEGMENLLINLSLCYIELKEYDKANEIVNAVFKSCGGPCTHEITVSGEHCRGLYNFQLKNYEAAIDHINLSYTMAKSTNDKRYQSENLLTLGKIAMEQKKYREARIKFEEVIFMCKEFQYNQILASTYFEFSRLYVRMGDFRKAAYYQNNYINLKDSLYSVGMIKNLARVQIAHAEYENLKLIKSQNENLALKEEAIQRQKLLSLALLAVTFLIAIIGVLIYRLYALRNKANKQLDVKVKQRTQQLEKGQMALQGVLSEQKLFMNNMREEMRALIATLNGVVSNQQDMIYSNAVSKLNILVERIDQKSNASVLSKAALSMAVIFLFSVPAFSQQINQTRFDSIKAHLPGKTLKDRHYLMYGMAYELFDVDNPIAKFYADSAWHLAKQLGDSLKITKSGRLRGQLLRRTDRLDEAIAQFKEILPIAERNGFTTEQKFALNALALTLSYRGIQDQALEYNFKSLEIREKEGDKMEISLTLTNIGFVFYKASDPQQALKFFNMALRVRKGLEDKLYLDQVFMNMALCYIYINDFEKADQFLTLAYEAMGENGSDFIKSQGEFCKGIILFRKEHYDEAMWHFNLAQGLAIKAGDSRLEADDDNVIAQVLMIRKDFKEAIRHLLHAEHLSKKFGYNQVLKETYQNFSVLYNEIRNHEKAAHYLQGYISLSDSLLNNNMIRNISRIQSDYDESENRKLIKALDDNLALNTAATKRQKLLNVVLVTVVCLLVVIGVLIYRLYLFRNKANQQLDVMIRQRTQQLEDRQATLQGVLNEQKVFMKNMREEMRALIATLNGAASDQQNMIYNNAVSKLNILVERIDQKSNASALSKAALSIAVIFIFSVPAFSQQINQLRFDSIKAHLPGKTLSDRHYLMHGMAYELFDVDNPSAKLYADTAWLLAKQLGDSFKITKSGRLRGQLLRRTDRLNEAIAQFQKVLPIARRNYFVKEEKYALNALAVAYVFKGVYDSALEVHFRSLQIREEEADKAEIAIALTNIGIVYYKIRDFNQALFFYESALNIENERNEKYTVNLLINLSLCYIHVKDFEKANELLEKAFTLCKGSCSDELIIAMEQGKGLYCFYSRKYQEAAMYLNRSYAVAKSVDDKRHLAENIFTLGQVSAVEGNYKQAIAQFEEAIDLSKQFSYNQILLDTYSELSSLLNRLGNFRKAAYYQNKYINLKDSMYSADMIKNLARVQIAHAEYENLKLIKSQNENLALKEGALHRQKLLSFALLAVTCLIAIIGVLIYRLYAIRNKTNQQLDVKVRQRTQQIEEGQAAMQRVVHDQHLFIESLREEMKALTATLQGLSSMDKDIFSKQVFLMTTGDTAGKLNVLIERIDKKRITARI